MTETAAMITEETVVVASPNLSFANLGGEAVVLHVETGRYYGLNEIGGFILEQSKSPIQVGQLVDQLLKEYDVERSRLLGDLSGFLEHLSAHQLVQLSPA